EQLVRQVNRAGARLAVEARNASGQPVLVAGSVRPLGRPIEPVRSIKRSSAERSFLEQVEALVERGVDLIVLETLTALPELAQAVAAGARILGGCCGTRPQHVAAMRDRLAAPGAAPAAGSAWQVSDQQAPAERPPPSRLASQLQGGRFVVSVELTPPRGIDPRKMLDGARLLKDAGVDFANITDSAMARLRMGVMSCAALVQQQVGLE